MFFLCSLHFRAFRARYPLSIHPPHRRACMPFACCIRPAAPTMPPRRMPPPCCIRPAEAATTPPRPDAAAVLHQTTSSSHHTAAPDAAAPPAIRPTSTPHQAYMPPHQADGGTHEVQRGAGFSLRISRFLSNSATKQHGFSKFMRT